MLIVLIILGSSGKGFLLDDSLNVFVVVGWFCWYGVSEVILGWSVMGMGFSLGVVFGIEG